MIFEALAAKYGDCLLLTIPAGDEWRRLLIDGGPAGVYRQSLKLRLDELREELELGDDPLPIEVVMVSHVDADHIAGILDIFGAMRDADERERPRPYDVRFLLHNSLDSLLGEGEGGAARALRKDTVLAGLGGEAKILSRNPKFSHTAMLVLQSYPQGSRLASIAAALSINRNPPDGRTIMYAGTKVRQLHLGDATLTVIGPREAEVDALREEWKKVKKGAKSDEDLAAYLDVSAPNLSSIVVLLECGGSKILLTGDARGDYILQGLKAAGMLKRRPFKVDLLKLPHHGSHHNVDLDFFESIHADHYVASGDGTYGNPDRATFELLAQARPDAKYTVHLTYSPTSCDATHKEYLKGYPKRPQYKASEHSLVGLFRSWKTNHPKIKVVHGAPISIEL